MPRFLPVFWIAAVLGHAQVWPIPAGDKDSGRAAFVPSGLDIAGPELLVGGEWTTSVRLVNRGTVATPLNRLRFIEHTGQPMEVKILVNGTAEFTTTGLDFAIAPGGSILIAFEGTADTRYGHMYMAPMCAPASGCSIYGEVTVRNRNATRPDFEAVFPLERPARTQHMLFDHRDGFSTLLYLVNDTAAASVATLELRAAEGNALIRTLTVNMAAGETQLLTLHALAPETISKYGVLTIKGVTPSGAEAFYIATGLRINPTNSFTAVRSFVSQ